jgi:hypothetical protein
MSFVVGEVLVCAKQEAIFRVVLPRVVVVIVVGPADEGLSIHSQSSMEILLGSFHHHEYSL